jgi:RNA polymerase sigma factor (sigma-70 family)
MCICVDDIGSINLDETIQGCLRKKEKSQEMLYKRFFGYALRVALIYNRNRENALEIVNDSFVKVFNQIDRYDNTLPFKSWLGKIVVNTSIDRFRKNKRDIQFDDKETFFVPDESPNILTQLTAEDILGLLNRLPEIQRMVFSLYEIEGYTHDEISSLLSIPENSSRVYLTRAKKRLRELFEMLFSNRYEKTGN